MAVYGGGATSVAVHDGLVAVAVPAAEDESGARCSFWIRKGLCSATVPVGALLDSVGDLHAGRAARRGCQ
jgi:hypothetical protein